MLKIQLKLSKGTSRFTGVLIQHIHYHDGDQVSIRKLKGKTDENRKHVKTLITWRGFRFKERPITGIQYPAY